MGLEEDEMSWSDLSERAPALFGGAELELHHGPSVSTRKRFVRLRVSSARRGSRFRGSGHPKLATAWKLPARHACGGTLELQRHFCLRRELATLVASSPRRNSRFL